MNCFTDSHVDETFALLTFTELQLECCPCEHTNPEHVCSEGSGEASAVWHPEPSADAS